MGRNTEVAALREAFYRERKLLAAEMRECRKRIIRKYGSTENFYRSLKFRFVDSPGDPGLQKGYDLYRSIFTLPEESESFEGFRRALELNADRELLERFGPYRECWLFVGSEEDDELLGGINYTAYSMPRCVKKKYDCRATLHIHYIFVRGEYRSLGIASRLLNEMERSADAWLAQSECLRGRVFSFCEQNAPELMTSEEYFTDCLHARIDQCDRLAWWCKKGYNRLRFNYFQPSLSEDAKACTILTLNVKQASGTQVPALILQEHLRRFFYISVLKAHEDGTASRLVGWLGTQNRIEVEGRPAFYKRLQKSFYSSEAVTRRPLSLLFDEPNVTG